ncbi:DUF6879 family protein [Nocardiopsis sp. NPDC050513]|uniref:DUF6879 family protein n=1 Tax=Nocardiopsis sp. NPDC050513 TaxID=3364338 RepID=UPI0037BA2472
MSVFLSEEEFVQQFHDFERTAWKLEVRDRYNVDGENEDVERFLRTGDPGRTDDHAATSPWHRDVTRGRKQGKVWQRVRVVSEPLSGYIAWEHAVTRFNVEAGEDIRWLPRHHPSVDDLPQLDFWLFDGRWSCVLHFDDDDAPRRLERIDDPAVIGRHRQWWETAWRHAIPHHEYEPRTPKRPR